MLSVLGGLLPLGCLTCNEGKSWSCQRRAWLPSWHGLPSGRTSFGRGEERRGVCPRSSFPLRLSKRGWTLSKGAQQGRGLQGCRTTQTGLQQGSRGLCSCKGNSSEVKEDGRGLTSQGERISVACLGESPASWRALPNPTVPRPGFNALGRPAAILFPCGILQTKWEVSLADTTQTGSASGGVILEKSVERWLKL